MNDLSPLHKIINPLSDRFNELNVFEKVSWEQERSFAMQQLSRTPKLMSAAINDPLGVKASILNLAAIGISLNPVLQHAYLVPRGGKICLDISFRGLIKTAVDSGSIKCCKSELVYEKDREDNKFEWRGVFSSPLHCADVFGERGKVIGGYCLAKLTDDSIMCETMSLAEINKARSKSKAQTGDVPWVNWWEEMAKKTLIKRASKTWPQTSGDDRLATAINVLNEHEGITINGSEVNKESVKYGVASLEARMLIDNEKEKPETEEKTEKPKLKDESVVSDITEFDLILDEIESACRDEDLSICKDKISKSEQISEEDKDKLRIAYKDKQKEFKNEKII